MWEVRGWAVVGESMGQSESFEAGCSTGCLPLRRSWDVKLVARNWFVSELGRSEDGDRRQT